MATLIPASEITHRIEQLLKDRQAYADAIIQIDKTLASVSAALGETKPAGVPAFAVKAMAPAVTQSFPAKPGKGTRSVFALNAEASVLAFIKKKGTALTKEVNQHFKSEGRASTADNTLSKLVADKKLKRLPLGKGIPGSAYELT